MKLSKVNLIEKFFEACDKCKGDVFLHSPHGDVYNIKSKLSQYVAVGELVSEHGDELELFCANSEDEHLFYEFFSEYPEVLYGVEEEEKIPFES